MWKIILSNVIEIAWCLAKMFFIVWPFFTVGNVFHVSTPAIVTSAIVFSLVYLRH